MYLLIILVLPFIGSLLSSLLPASQRTLHALLAGVVAAGCALFTLLCTPAIFKGDVLFYSTHWIPTHALISLYAWMGLLGYLV